MHGLDRATTAETGVNEVSEEKLLRACEEFWVLMRSKETYFRNSRVMGISSAKDNEVLAVQLRSIKIVDIIRNFSPQSAEGQAEKLKVLKCLGAAADFEDTDVFRELVALLDEMDVPFGGREQVGSIKPSGKIRSWRFNLHNILGNSGN